jgi:hypothetical protein
MTGNGFFTWVFQAKGPAVSFPSKHDWFAYFALLGALGMIVLGVFFLAVPPPRPEDTVPLTVAGFIGPVIGGLLLWAFFGTVYVIDPPYLMIRFGPYRKRISLDALVEAIPRQRLFPTDGGWSLAWSLDRVCLKYRKASGKMAWPFVISPADKGRFLRELREVCPELKISRSPDRTAASE